MSRRHVVLFSFCALLLVFLLPSCLHAEVLFGPVTVQGGQTHVASFPMYCRCTAYFLEARNASTEEMRPASIILNGEVVMEVEMQWTQMSRQVELREDGENEIEIVVPLPAGAGVEVRVYERDVMPSPMEGREYAKERGPRRWERFGERFVLNHWARRFHVAVENGNPDGSGRVTQGRVFVNGEEVIGTGQLHSGVGSVSVEVELQEGENDIQALLLGPTGSKIRLGIEEPAQTVTVTEVWEADVPFVAELGTISSTGGMTLVRVTDQARLAEVDETGNVAMRVSPADLMAGDEVPGAISYYGRYVWTTAVENGEYVSRLYGPSWNLVHEIIGERRAIRQISDAGNVLLGYDPATAHLDACGGGELGLVYNQSGTQVSTIPMGRAPADIDVLNHLSPDGLTCWIFCDGELQVYGTDGQFRWAAPSRESRQLANGGVAVQATTDSLLMYGAAGSVTRTVVNARPANQIGLARIAPDGAFAIHGGDAIMVARREGPQSCWRFDPGPNDWVFWMWISDNGRWVLAMAARPHPQAVPVWLIGAGGGVVWTNAESHAFPPWTLLSEDGGRFLLPSLDWDAGVTTCRVYAVSED